MIRAGAEPQVAARGIEARRQDEPWLRLRQPDPAKPGAPGAAEMDKEYRLKYIFQVKFCASEIGLSATDLTGHLSCGHLTQMDVQVARGARVRPHHWDPLLEVLRERGYRHEQEFVAHLGEQGLSVVVIADPEIGADSIGATSKAMREGIDVIVQGALQHGRWSGRADILRRVEERSDFGAWSYEVVDTKLARETRGSTVLQLCLYSDLVARIQGRQPEYAYVVAPWTGFEPEAHRVADYIAFFRKARAAIEQATTEADRPATYPIPNPHCDFCRWADDCEKTLRADDSLTFVAGISKNQITELRENGIARLDELADLGRLPWAPKRGAAQTYEKIIHQARLQVSARQTGGRLHELLPIEEGFGLCVLPQPSEGDIFFDLEGDPFAGEGGLEYLFGYSFRGEDGALAYQSRWALTREQERAAFEGFVDFVSERLAIHPNLHIYHYAPYEPAALKRLMGRYATRENEIDDLLRGRKFVDLFSVVRHALRASVESYSIKQLEGFYAYARKVPLREANKALAAMQSGLELGHLVSSDDAAAGVVRGYNEDDCASTHALRAWLEAQRDALVAAGTDVPRPNPIAEPPTQELRERLRRFAELSQRLTADLPVDRTARSQEQQGLWLLGNIVDWHRREDKASYWEKFRLAALSTEELLEERVGLSGLAFVGEVGQDGRLPIHRYSFPAQDTDIRPGKKLRMVEGESLGEVHDISVQARTIDIKKMRKTIDEHPAAVYAHELVPSDEQADCLFRIGDYVAEHGIAGDGPYFAARSLLLRSLPDLSGSPMKHQGESSLDAALRLADRFERGILPVQGPPGTGKSYTGARMICRFVERGLKVGITATSHKVIRNLLDEVLKAAREMNVDVRCIQKPKDMEDALDRLTFAKTNEALLGALAAGECQVAGATSFLWSRAEALGSVDVLVVDEAAQMSLANVLAVSHASVRLILLGDPQQLDEPTQGTHPEGTGGSSLEHVLEGRQTIGDEQGLFLAQTWRMHPAICAFDSELFYEGKLTSVEGCEHQSILSTGAWGGSGLRYVPVPHAGNKSASIEEAGVVTQLVMAILGSDCRWIDRHGAEHPVTMRDILIITPYNAQVFEIQQRLPDARVGTVDKFQGQEAPIAIYSMATSSYADAPRGMEFLYSANRFNVAISRAKCLAVLVASPKVFEAECKTPQQMRLANAFCRFLEIAPTINI